MLLITVMLVCYLAAFALLFAFQRNLIFPYGTERPDPASLSTSMREQTVTTPDGVELIVWTHDTGPATPVIVYFHGNGGTLSMRLWRYHWMIGQGWSVVAVGQRGGSGSGGSPSEAGHAIDARAVYDSLSDLLGRSVAPETVVLYGESLGSGIAVTLATERTVGAVILETPYAAIDDLVQAKFRFFPIKLLRAVRDPFRSIDRIASLNAPLFILHGTADRMIPLQHAERLFEAAAEPKSHRWIEGGGHNDLWQGGATGAIAEFMQETFGAAESRPAPQ